jgi:hypothetical protein
MHIIITIMHRIIIIIIINASSDQSIQWSVTVGLLHVSRSNLGSPTNSRY